MRRTSVWAGRRATVFSAMIALDLLVLAAGLRGETWVRRLSGEPCGDERLITAAMTGDAAEISRALADGAHPDATPSASEETALMWAALSGDVASVRRLLEAGADLHATTSRGQNVLSAAVCGGRADVVKLVLAQGLDVNACPPQAGTALKCAAWQGNEEMVDLLLSRGADPSLAGADGVTPLQVCDGIGRERIAARLQAALARRRDARAAQVASLPHP